MHTTLWSRIMQEFKPTLRRLEEIVREVLSRSFEPDLIGPIIEQTELDNPAAQFIGGSALESAGEHAEAVTWFRRSAAQGYRPALDHLRPNS
ncbi:MAG TPA: hypothetical protein VF135_14195, partial [Terriglobales bacterium]